MSGQRSEPDISRRGYLKLAGAVATGIGVDTAANIYRQNDIDEANFLSPEDYDQDYDAAIERIANGCDLKVHLLNLYRDEPRYNSSEWTETIEKELDALKDVEPVVKDYEIEIDSKLQEIIKETETPQVFRGENEEYFRNSVNQLMQEQGVEREEGEPVVFVGDFNTWLGQYKGSCYEGPYSVISNARSDVYTTNQILHNLGHTLSLPHAYTPVADQMSWSPGKEARAHLDIVPFGPESKRNWEEVLENYEEIIESE